MTKPAFIIVDLELESTSSLAPFVSAVEGELVVLHSESEGGTHAAAVEFAMGPEDPENSILAYLRLVSSLEGAAKAAWLACSRRTFNVGLDSGTKGGPHEFHLSNETLREVVAAGADVAVTLYPADPKAPATDSD